MTDHEGFRPHDEPHDEPRDEPRDEPGDPTRADPEALELLERFDAAMRRDDLEEAQSLAPDVEIRTEGWPYEDETGPLNPDAFRAGDPRDHEVIAWQRLPSGRVVVRTGITYLEMERPGDGPLLIVRGYHKPIE